VLLPVSTLKSLLTNCRDVAEGGGGYGTFATMQGNGAQAPADNLKMRTAKGYGDA